MTSKQADNVIKLLEFVGKRPSMFLGKPDIQLAEVFLMGVTATLDKVFVRRPIRSDVVEERGWTVPQGNASSGLHQQMTKRGLSPEEVIQERVAIEIEVIKRSSAYAAEPKGKPTQSRKLPVRRHKSSWPLQAVVVVQHPSDGWLVHDYVNTWRQANRWKSTASRIRASLKKRLSGFERHSITLTHQSGWILSHHADGRVVWESLETHDPPRHMKAVPLGEFLKLGTKLERSDLKGIEAEAWLPGYGLD